MEKPFVYVTRALPEEQLSSLKEAAHIEMWEKEDEPCPRAVLLEKAKTAAGLLTMLSDRIDSELLSEARQLKVVANLAVGYDNIDVEAAKKHRVICCNTPGVLTESTADLTFALLMAASRRIIEASDWIKQGRWTGWGPLLLAGADVHHKTIGIVGMGSIGRAVARRAKGFGMKILYHNRSRSQEAEAELGAVYTSFPQLLEQSDFVVCLTPLTNETNHLFNRSAFQKMKRTAIFINASRGQVVDEADLYEALVNKEIRGAGLDVFAEEPISKDHPLVSLPQVTALPHIGSATNETREAMMRLCAENIALVLGGEPARTEL
ncbi:2-hydroxyacid dehydrogenase [Bacillus sonorensis]|uniref:2-hydroxyacid dehydrogenase n=1 Tax=Bacillus sonorensis TaxID=119858 RepID=UPI00098ACE4A|nr:D-glycerate dehydrogenase [Bacillus sonorensis]